MRQSGHNDSNNRRHELDALRKMLDSEVTKGKSNNLIINDLKTTVTNEIRERARLQNEHSSVEERVKKEYKGRLDDMESHFSRIQKEGAGFLNGLDKFRNIIVGKLRTLLKVTDQLKDRMASLGRECTISYENQKFMEKLKIRGPAINAVIESFKKLVLDAHRKIDVLRKEANDATFFAESNKKTLEEFHKQFNEAKSEFVFCRKYLEKKSAENKNLKNENARLLREISLRPADISKKAYDGLSANFAIKNNVK